MLDSVLSLVSWEEVWPEAGDNGIKTFLGELEIIVDDMLDKATFAFNMRRDNASCLDLLYNVPVRLFESFRSFEKKILSNFLGGQSKNFPVQKAEVRQLQENLVTTCIQELQKVVPHQLKLCGEKLWPADKPCDPCTPAEASAFHCLRPHLVDVPPHSLR